MKSIATILLLAGAAVALPTTDSGVTGSGTVVCPSAPYLSPRCCAAHVLGGAGADCTAPPRYPESSDEFAAMCAESGKSASCCAAPVAGQGVACQRMVG
ncbi:hypothetical protein MFIFM68171_02124 [Madurella fahalii]|uniref:Uncharacterized protein n=1 Tax=Madurella fahalii TaxID=1157608 RepID=A0ABQ0G2E4_9PEZI